MFFQTSIDLVFVAISGSSEAALLKRLSEGVLNICTPRASPAFNYEFQT